MPRKKAIQSFVSKADTKEMRDYQLTASEYPPLPKEELIAVSRKFIEGRRASVTLMEHDVLDSILSGNWDADADREEVTEAFRSHMEEEYEQGRMPKDVHDIVAKDILEMEDSYDLFLETRRLDRQTVRRLSRLEDAGNEALAQIVNHNLQFAMACVGKMMRRNRRAKLIGAKELIAVANVGLVLGARQYDPESNKAFTTYAAYHINGQLYDYLNREDGNIGIKAATLHEQKQIISIRQVMDVFKGRYGREPNIAEISSLTHISQDRVISRLDTPTIKTQSIFSKGKGEESDEQEVFLPDLVMDGSNGVETEWASQGRADAMERVVTGMAELPSPQSEIVRLHIGLTPDGEEQRSMTVKQIARELKMTPHSVERELHNALKALRTGLAEAGIADYMAMGDDLVLPDEEEQEAAPTAQYAAQATTTAKTSEDDDSGLPGPEPGEPNLVKAMWDEAEDMEIDIDDSLLPDDAQLRLFAAGWATMEETSRMREMLSKTDDEGYDMLGYDAEGYNRLGFDRRGLHRDGRTTVRSIVGDGPAYPFVRRLFDAGQRQLPGLLEAMRLAGVARPDVHLGGDGRIEISGSGVLISRGATGVMTFRLDPRTI